MKQSQVESRTELMHLTQSDLNSSSVEEMLLSEISSVISANENMELNADPVITEHVEQNADSELDLADGSSDSTMDEMQEGVGSNVTLEESVQVVRSDVQMDEQMDVFDTNSFKFDRDSIMVLR